MPLLSVCLTLALALPAGAWASAPPIPDLPDRVEKTLPGVVNISSTTVLKEQVFGMDDFLGFWGVPRERRLTSLGTGFLIDQDGYILTNAHVVDRATEVMVTLLDKRQFRARIIGKDDKMDVALIQVRPEGAKLSPVPLGDSDATRIAESVFTVGNPMGLQHTVTVGIISAKHRTIGQGPFDNFLQTDAAINPGNSGGPLFNLKGEVIGINTAIFSRTGQSGGIGFAIPINEARLLVPDLKRYGRIPRPWLGVRAETLTPQLQAYFELPASEGVLVYTLIEGAPAHQAGLRQGDIIVEMDGKPVKDAYDAERALAKKKPRDTSAIKVLRGSRKIEKKIRLEELPRLDRLPTGII
jgi:serine protease Do